MSEVIGATISTAEELSDAYGDDIGDNFFVKLGSAVGGGALGCIIGNKLGNGKPLGTIIGLLGGAVLMYNVAPEIATDIQRGNQAVDQQVERGESEGNLADRFSAVCSNLANIGGQSVTPTVESVDVTDNM